LDLIRSDRLRLGLLQGLKEAMANHPNRKPVSHEQMVENHTDFYPANRSFQNKALRGTGVVRIVGSPNATRLWICVEWDTETVLLGYHWQPPLSGARARARLESWFSCSDLVIANLGSHTEREMTNINPVDVIQQDHDFILKTARECQKVLDDDCLDSTSKVHAVEQILKIETNSTTS
jgi:hypothetical protein